MPPRAAAQSDHVHADKRTHKKRSRQNVDKNVDESAAKNLDEKWMARALTLARRGEALAGPNPMVGAILVRHGKIVGQGFHTYDGVRHAEVLALDAAGKAARGATLYVNLEPCAHQGRTPPCTRALIAAGVARVVAAMPDPNPRVAGRGLRQLRAADIEVESAGALRHAAIREQARRLNEAFAVWITLHRPFVTLKSALTLDGQLVLPPQAPGPGKKNFAGKKSAGQWITSEASRAEVQRMRHASDALLTGIGTVLADDPLLTDRTGLARRRPLLRVVLDSRLRLSPRSRLVRSARGDVLVFTGATPPGARARALRRAGVEVVALQPSRGGHSERSEESLHRLDLRAVLRELGRRDILSVLLEAGPTLNQAALDLGLVDKLRFFYAPKVAGHRMDPPRAGKLLSRLRALSDLRVEQFGPDVAVEAYLRDVYRR
jgi:diaminohydroxyphosphoribosylaminopyrimidine deaminase/5-amino-6-(5-phosphoribosylamino)uracil reductase